MQRAIIPLTLFFVLLLGIPTTGRTEDAQSPAAAAPSPYAAVMGSETLDWESIEELDLNMAARVALQANPTLAAAQERIEQAKERLAQARGTYWPRIDGSLSGARVTLSDNNAQEQLRLARLFDPNAQINDSDAQYRTGLSATWLLFDGFSREFRNASARYGESRSESSRQDVKRTLLQAVASAYFSAQLAQENVSIAQSDEGFNQRQFKDAKARRRVGTGSLSDEYNFEIRVNSARTLRITAERSYQEAMFGLAALLGVEGSLFPSHIRLARLKAEADEEMAPPDPDTLVAYANAHRPDVKEAEYSVQQAEADVKVERGRFFPTIDFAATVNGERTDDMHFDSTDFGNTVGLNLTYNFFSGGSDLAGYRRAKARQRELSKSMENLLLQVNSTVRTSVKTVISTQQQLVLQRSNAELNQKNRDLVAKEYAAGQVSLVRLNEAQRDLTTAKGRLALALAALRQAWFNLETDTGHILEIFPD